MLAHVADAGGMELRIFPRDGQNVGRDAKANPADSPNADIMNEFLYEKGGQTFHGRLRALQLSPFFSVWASATVDEILSALHERIVVGSLA